MNSSYPSDWLPDSYWVVPGKLLAGEYPGGHDPEHTRQRLRALLDLGVRVFIDLTWEGEGEPYQELLRQEATERGIEVEHIRFPIADLGIPSRTTMRAILDSIDQSLAANLGTYIHCWFGLGRTGTVVGCYLVRHGASGPEALERLQYLRRETAKWWRSSPETAEQCAMITSWHVGE
ncbi:hypothetical protein [uncultured Thermanaerothrix sp.]|uniref:protein-tyrosine phosphatase family protein n=1 Tax=uncultured Thermanaerothrix sp. TaxID=1195149 RepID=UPI00260AF508|nr:hypothetical protein [uncultured Thermanaerothrix sp.]